MFRGWREERGKERRERAGNKCTLDHEGRGRQRAKYGGQDKMERHGEDLESHSVGKETEMGGSWITQASPATA